jgi:hypothetical protein
VKRKFYKIRELSCLPQQFITWIRQLSIAVTRYRWQLERKFFLPGTSTSYLVSIPKREKKEPKTLAKTDQQSCRPAEGVVLFVEKRTKNRDQERERERE